MGSGTIGLQLALQLAGVRPGDEVLLPDLTFIAPVQAISGCGAHPVLVDVNPVDWQLDVDKIERFLEVDCEIRDGECFDKKTGKRVRAILPVHILGLAGPVDRVVKLARRFGLAVIEDAAEAVGVRYKGQHVGTFGDIGVFSFNGNKIMTSAAGGMVIFPDSGKLERARELNVSRLSNIHSAIGVAQLERIAEFISRKRHIAEKYSQVIAQMQSVTAMPCPPDVEPTYWLYTVLLAPGTGLDRRDRILRRLNEEGIGARPRWHPVHDLAAFRSARTVGIEHSVRLYGRGISLPCSVGISETDLDKCIDVFRRVVEEDAVLR